MRKWLDPITTAWSGVVTHKLRSFLTILGIVIGVAAVIALMSIGRGVSVNILSSIENIASDLITITPGSFTFGGVRGGVAQTLTLEDAEAIEESVTNIAAIAPTVNSNLQVVVGGENTNASITGTTPEYKIVNDLELSSGTFFSEQDYQRASKVVVIGSDIAEDLFPGTDPVGQQMRMGTIIVRVIGVLKATEGFMMFTSSNSAIYIPLTAMQQTVSLQRTQRGDNIVSSIAITAIEPEKSSEVVEDITSLLRNRHQLEPGTDDDFRITSIEEISQSATTATNYLTLLLGAIAAISLLVGGIGVMNIMLVSVLERTREIGIRKALGAQEWHIWLQFLIEAAILTFTGGIVGVVFGWLIAFFLNQSELIPAVVQADIVVIAVVVSVGIGLIFGVYPAVNASRLNPIEALRSE